jgi:hypothetical protein
LAPSGLVVLVLLALLATATLANQAWIASAILGTSAMAIGLRSLQERSIAMGRIRAGIKELAARETVEPDLRVA